MVVKIKRHLKFSYVIIEYLGKRQKIIECVLIFSYYLFMSKCKLSYSMGIVKQFISSLGYVTPLKYGY